MAGGFFSESVETPGIVAGAGLALGAAFVWIATDGAVMDWVWGLLAFAFVAAVAPLAYGGAQILLAPSAA